MHEGDQNMKILQIGDTDMASRRFSGYDLNNALRARGFDAQQSVWWKNQEKSISHTLSSKLSQRESLRDYLSKINTHYSTNSLFYPFSYGLFFDKQFLDCDVAHLHLIHNYFFDISHLPIITRTKPIVWTLHDLWPLQGHCVHPLDCDRWKNGCGNCPDITRSFEIKQDTSALNWEYKKQVFSSCEMDLIVASRWMYDQIKESSFFPKCEIHLINFGLDLSIFKPLENRDFIRKKFGIPKENVVIAFRASKWIYKGFNHIYKCLQSLSTTTPLTLIIFDEKNLFRDFSRQFQIIEVGWVENENELVRLLNAADIFLMPSVAESFGMMAMEAMACGKPVMVMNRTALPDVIKPDESGCIVIDQGDNAMLVSKLSELIDNHTLRNEIGQRTRKTAEKYYNYHDYVEKIVEIYENLYQRKKKDVRAQFIIQQQKKCVFSQSDESPVFPLGNVINILSDVNNGMDIDGINISNKEFKILKLFLVIERSKVVRLIYNFIKPFFQALKKK